MKLKVVNDADGCPAVQVIDDETGEVFKSVELPHDKQIEIDVPEVEDLSTITIGEVADSEGDGDGD